MKKTISVLLIIFIILTLSTLPSYALGFTIDVTPDKKIITEGGKVTVTISTNNLNIGGEGMNVFSCILEYDENMFNPITANDIQGLNNWSVSYNTVTGKILLDNSTFITTDADLCKITFTAKEGAELQDTQIKITEPKTSNNKIDISGTAGETTIYVKQLTSDKYEITEENTIKNVATNTTVEVLKQNLTSGSEITVVDKNGTIITSGNVGTGSKVKTEAGEEYTIIILGDVNGDGKISSTDASLLKLHIVESTLLKEPFLSAGDLNGDKNVKSTDLSKVLLAIVGL